MDASLRPESTAVLLGICLCSLPFALNVGYMEPKSLSLAPDGTQIVSVYGLCHIHKANGPMVALGRTE